MNSKKQKYRAKNNGIVLYDFLYCKGGAEKVTIELAKSIPNTDICVGFRDEKLFADIDMAGINCFEIGKDKGHRISALRTLNSIYGFSGKIPFLQNYDWAIFSGSYAPMAVHNRLQKKNICYCHTIPRFAYDLHQYYLKIIPFWKRLPFRMVSAYIRKIYRHAMIKMDLVIANSENVRMRIKRYIGLDAMVIYPPCDVKSFKWIGQGDYYLSTARLERYKRVDLIVEAFRKMPEKKLIVASGGSDFQRLVKLAGNCQNIIFLGWTDENKIKELVGQAIATIYIPRDEDFGMSPVESMASGKPVIGVSEGGLIETIIKGKTGTLVKKNPGIEDIIRAVQDMTHERAFRMREDCEKNAQKFSTERFIEAIHKIIAD